MGEETKKVFIILSIDAWANGDDGWSWNAWHKVGEFDGDITIMDNSQELIKWFVDNGYLQPSAVQLVYVDDDQNNLVITEKSNHRPLFAVEYGSQY